MYAEYSSAPKNARERMQMAQKYLKKATDLIKADPWDYLLTRMKKMWTMWQKKNIFFYYETNFEKHWLYTCLSNLILLALAAFGLVISLYTKNPLVRKTSFLVLALFFYMTFSLSLTHAEPRLTLSFYPLLFLYGCAGGVICLRKH